MVTAALIVLGIVAYFVIAGVVGAVCDRLWAKGDGDSVGAGIAWPILLVVWSFMLGSWLARPRPKPDPDAELRELDERFAAELGIETREKS